MEKHDCLISTNIFQQKQEVGGDRDGRESKVFIKRHIEKAFSELSVLFAEPFYGLILSLSDKSLSDLSQPVVYIFTGFK